MDLNTLASFGTPDFCTIRAKQPDTEVFLKKGHCTACADGPGERACHGQPPEVVSALRRRAAGKAAGEHAHDAARGCVDERGPAAAAQGRPLRPHDLVRMPVKIGALPHTSCRSAPQHDLAVPSLHKPHRPHHLAINIRQLRPTPHTSRRASFTGAVSTPTDMTASWQRGVWDAQCGAKM